LKVDVTFEQYLKVVNDKAERFGAIKLCGPYDEQPAWSKEDIAETHSFIDEFEFMSREDYERQVKTDGYGAMGEGAKTGDLMWCDGERLCCQENIEYWHNLAQPEEGTCLSWLECAELTKQEFIIEAFKAYKKTLGETRYPI
jgi:hypothetical protein